MIFSLFVSSNSDPFVGFSITTQICLSFSFSWKNPRRNHFLFGMLFGFPYIYIYIYGVLKMIFCFFLFCGLWCFVAWNSQRVVEEGVSPWPRRRSSSNILLVCFFLNLILSFWLIVSGFLVLLFFSFFMNPKKRIFVMAHFGVKGWHKYNCVIKFVNWIFFFFSVWEIRLEWIFYRIVFGFFSCFSWSWLGLCSFIAIFIC